MNNWKIILTKLVEDSSVSCTEVTDAELDNSASKELHMSSQLLVQTSGPLGQCFMFDTDSFPWQQTSRCFVFHISDLHHGVASISC